MIIVPTIEIPQDDPPSIHTNPGVVEIHLHYVDLHAKYPGLERQRQVVIDPQALAALYKLQYTAPWT